MLTSLEHLRRDLVHAARSLSRAPAFALTVIATIALGMGAIAAVLGIVDKAYFQRLPVPNPERIVEVQAKDSRPSMRRLFHGSFPDYRDVRAAVQGLEGLAAYHMENVKLGGDAEYAGLEVGSAFVSGNYFTVLRASPARGRYFHPDEEEPRGAHPVVVMSDVLWRNAFGGDERIVGKRILIGSAEFTVVGVAPPGFTGIQPEGRTDLWIPYTMFEQAVRPSEIVYREREYRRAFMFGRLADGVTLAAVQGSLDNVGRMLAAAYPQTNETLTFRAKTRARLANVDAAPQALMMFGLALAMVALVHLIACANIASLLLARGAARRREMGVRICLGASRGRILLQTLAEPMLLGLGGAVAAVFVARALNRAIGSMWFMSALEPSLDVRMVAIVLGVAAITVAKFGMMPAIAAAGTDPIEVVQGSAGRIRGAKSGTSGVLIAAQVAMSVLLMAQAALLLGKFERETSADLGFDWRRTVVARTERQGNASFAAVASVHEAALERVAALPGVTRVSSAGSPPFLIRWYGDVTPVGTAVDQQPVAVSIQSVDVGYFATIGARIVEGREFDATDRRASKPPYFYDVAVVNQAFARRYWPDMSAVGQIVRFAGKPVRIVGVVADVRDIRLSAAIPRLHFPLLQYPMSGFTIVAAVANESDVPAAAARMRAALRSLPDMEPATAQTIAELRDMAALNTRIMAIALSISAGVALLLTALGLYGAVTMWAANRRRELGVRIALGAPARHVYQLLMKDAGRLALIGGAVGTFGALVLVRVERSAFGPSMALDAAPVALVVSVFVVVVTAAAVLPARKATKLQPTEVMRAD